jgi:hypothetical protein
MGGGQEMSGRSLTFPVILTSNHNHVRRACSQERLSCLLRLEPTGFVNERVKTNIRTWIRLRILLRELSLVSWNACVYRRLKANPVYIISLS